ncbi:MAG: hypothetical protein ACFCVD_12750 [Nodosilinea sp.]
MKHADNETLAQLAPLLEQIRQRVPPLTEKGAGRFYLKAVALLHFHHDPAGLLADIKVNGNWQRYPVNDAKDYAALLSTLDAQLSLQPKV